tara:strand:- start:353 stop:556 length:204 start_codon:yes stop_codon:yes gene_type:complete
MPDSQIAEKLRTVYGDDKYKIFCEMQITKSEMSDEESRKINNEPNDASYEAYFWRFKLNELLNKPNY